MYTHFLLLDTLATANGSLPLPQCIPLAISAQLVVMILVLVGPVLRVYVRLLDRKCDSVASKNHLRNERALCVIPFGGAVAGACGWLVVQACAPRHGRKVLSKQLFVVVGCLAREIRTTHASGCRVAILADIYGVLSLAI